MAEENAPKRLIRSRGNRVFAGVLGGVGEYLSVDPVAVRALYVVAAFLTGVFPLTIAYLILAVIIPERRDA